MTDDEQAIFDDIFGAGNVVDLATRRSLESLAKRAPTPQERLQAEQGSLAAKAAALQVTDERTLAEAGLLARALAQFKKGVEALFKPMERDAKAALDTVRAQKKAMLDAALKADAAIRRQMADYDARRRAEAEAARAARQVAAKRQAEEEALGRAVLLEQAAQETGNARYAEAAEEVLAHVVEAVPAADPVPAKVEGVSFRDEVSVVVEDLGLLLGAIQAGTVDMRAVKADTAWLTREAEQRGVAFAVPGVRRVVTRDVTVRA